MGRVIPWIVMMTAAASPASACAMSTPASRAPHCVVLDGGKLPADSGGVAALCSAIERAVSERVPGAAYSAEIRVISASRLVATLTINGRRLPEHNFASMDRDLTAGAFDRFARALADQVAKGQK